MEMSLGMCLRGEEVEPWLQQTFREICDAQGVFSSLSVEMIEIFGPKQCRLHQVQAEPFVNSQAASSGSGLAPKPGSDHDDSMVYAFSHESYLLSRTASMNTENFDLRASLLR